MGAAMTVSMPAAPGGDNLPTHGVEIAVQVRHVARAPAGPAQRGCHRLDARRERGIGLVGEPVIVLDVVDAAVRKAGRQLPELLRRQPLRLERGRGQRPRRRRQPPPQPAGAVARPAEGIGKLARDYDVAEYHIILQRAVAEQHVEQLPGIIAHGRGSERNAHLEPALLLGDDFVHPADDALQHERVADCRERHLDALLDRDGAGTRLDRAGIAADAIDGG